MAQVQAGFEQVRPLRVTEVEDEALDAVRDLHAPDYVSFLLALSAALGASETYIPSVFRANPADAPVRVRGGAFCEEIGTPIGPHTLAAALCSAATALRGAERLSEGHGEVAALCRPPGHHAGYRRYGGYCYFNNAYLAARRLFGAGRCAVLDLDYHLGDGSMEFATPQIPYFSLHADPWQSYPFLSTGQAISRAGVNLFSLEANCDGAVYLNSLTTVCEAVRAHRPDYLVLSIGFDTLGSDYIQDQPVGLTVDDFAAVGELVAGIGARTLFLLEGGYDAGRLADCAASFLGGYYRRETA